MDTVINRVHIHVTKKNEQRLVFANGSLQSYAMAWNKGAYKWEFVTQGVPDILLANEMEISNAIIMSERTKKV